MLSKGSHVHLIGIGGAGLSAIARVLHARGHTVSGSDRSPSPLADSLARLGVQVRIGHQAGEIAGADLVVRSSAVPEDNVAVAAARTAGIPVMKRSEFLPELTAGQDVIAPAGTHGKTTTASMAAWLLHDQGLDPSYIIGGKPADLGVNAHAGRGRFFVIEADEYDRMFHGLQPAIAVVTNVEHDHPDIFPTPADFDHAFDIFVDRIEPAGVLIAWGDSASTRRLLDRIAATGRKTISYGIDAASDLQAVDTEPIPGAGYAFTVLAGGNRLGRIRLQVPGAHNVLNALAVAAIGLEVGLGFDRIAESLGHFNGVGRRFELVGEAGGVLVIDDYAHHPTEIRATLAAARNRYPDRTIWVAWQPHTYSRIQLLSSEFAAAFEDADHVVLTGVYAARETPPVGFSLDGLIREMAHPDARHFAGLDEAARYLGEALGPGSVLLVLSAGDADRISRDVLKQLNG
jgi:UDP-N-acetylmuramate--alanine ligase